MRRILMVTENRALFEQSIEDLAGNRQAQIDWADSCDSALAAVKAKRPDLLIADARIGGRDGLELCRAVLRTDAFVNMAAVSDLDEDTFHEASEGLGLIGRLPPQPGPKDFEDLMALLAAVVSPNPVPQT